MERIPEPMNGVLNARCRGEWLMIGHKYDKRRKPEKGRNAYYRQYKKIVRNRLKIIRIEADVAALQALTQKKVQAVLRKYRKEKGHEQQGKCNAR